MDPQVELQILAQLAELTEEIRALRSEWQCTRLHRGDQVKLERLLSCIHKQLEAEPWPVAWVLDASDDIVPGAAELLLAVDSILGKGKPTSRAKRLGIFLSRYLGVVGPWRLELTQGQTRAGNVYSVRPVTVTPASLTRRR